MDKETVSSLEYESFRINKNDSSGTIQFVNAIRCLVVCYGALKWFAFNS